ncbi:rhomboid family intramembrane serine protease [Planctomycetota bacterium]
MLLILPYKTSITPRHTPYANYILIAANVFIFFLEFGINPQTREFDFRPWVNHFMLAAVRPELWQFVSYAFLHGGLLHIIGNMFFLYLFGNNVNDKLGNVGYLAFYLAGAVFSGVGHNLVGGGPVLGASGAVAAVTGAYLVLFPQTLITVFYIFFFFGRFEWPAMYFILLKLILFDNVITRYTANVAYDAHLSGYAYGIAAMMAMLATGLVSSTHFDLWDIFRQWNRRRQFRDVVSGGYDPFTGTKKIKVKEVKKTPAQQQAEEEALRLRNEISNRFLERNVSAAAETYLQLMRHDDLQVLPRQQLLDIANHLAGSSMHSEAANAYEQFLHYYKNYEHAEQVELMLGLIYSRYLHQHDQAVKHLQNAESKLLDPGQKKMCHNELELLKK